MSHEHIYCVVLAGGSGERLWPLSRQCRPKQLLALEDGATFLEQALDRVELVNDDKIAKVWLEEDQRSLAIGKMGQNIALASRLVGIDIQLVQKEVEKEREELVEQIDIDSDSDAE